MFKLILLAAVLALLPSSATALQTADKADNAPTAAELQALIEAGWPSFARRIRQQDRLTETPSVLAGLPQALCRRELPETYECVSLVEYQLPNGTQRTSLLRHEVSRDRQGRLSDAIIVRETPAPR
jgi:hypothetical protein